MPDLVNALADAWRLVLSGDPTLVAIVWLSLSISLTAVVFATALGLPLGAALAVLRFPGRNAAVVLVNTLMGLPPVVAGLFVYLLLSRSGPLDGLGLLFTPTAMIIAQSVLVTPIVAGVARQALEDLWREYRELYVLDGVGRLRTMCSLLWLGRFSLLTGPRLRIACLRLGGRSRRHPDRRRQYRRGHPHDDDRDHPGDQPRRSGAGARPRHHPAGAGAGDQCDGAVHPQ